MINWDKIAEHRKYYIRVYLTKDILYTYIYIYIHCICYDWIGDFHFPMNHAMNVPLCVDFPESQCNNSRGFWRFNMGIHSGSGNLRHAALEDRHILFMASCQKGIVM